MTHKDSLLEAISIIGSQVLLAKLIGVKLPRLNNWLNRDKEVPAKYAIAIEYVTQGKVKRWELCPSLSSDCTDQWDILNRIKCLEMTMNTLQQDLNKVSAELFHH
jgi:DNA-binding transcriptional regulator YdaS (Cro superfamily)